MTNSTLDKDERILIVGAGTFGLSTAYHLAKRGYANVCVVDPYAYPSKLSAGHDISKVMRTQYNNPMYARLAHEARKGWLEEPFARHYHQTGVVWFEHRDSSQQISYADQARGLTNSFVDMHKYGDASGLRQLDSFEDIKQHVSMVEESDVANGLWGWYDGNAGWVAARDSLETVAEEAKKRGVQFLHGDSAAMASLLRVDGRVIGIVAKDGTEHVAERVVLCLGGWSESLLDFEGQLVSGGYGIVHLNLDQEQADTLRGMPVIALDGVGFVCPPTEDNILKCVALENVVSNYVQVQGRGQVSIPDAEGYLGDTTSRSLPDRDEKQALRVLNYVLPSLSTLPIAYSRFCWDSQSIDGGWIISPHPSSPTSLYVATGGSGHTFKNLPTLGAYVVDMLEGKLDEDKESAWRWRPDIVGESKPLCLYDLGRDTPPPLHG